MTNLIRLTALTLTAVLMSVPLSAPMAHADGHCTDDAIALGEKQYRKCKACHKLEDGKNGVGPHLFGVVGRGVADIDGYKYSSAMVEFGSDAEKVWDEALLSAYLEKPKDLVKGTKMAFGGIKKEDQRNAVICYLAKTGG